MNTRPLYIFDLDGTLANIDHRLHHISGKEIRCTVCRGSGTVESTFVQPRVMSCAACQGTGWLEREADWDAFFSACVEDEPIQATMTTMKMLRLAGAEVFIWTGRSEVALSQTAAWLHEHVGLGGIVKMRSAGDRTPDDQLKKSWYEALSPEDKVRLVAVFEDRSRVVKMWRELGVTCYQVAEGGF